MNPGAGRPRRGPWGRGAGRANDRSEVLPAMMSRYYQFSKSAYYGVVAAIPMLLAYELLLMFSGNHFFGQVRNAGDVWLRWVLASLDVRPSQATLVMVLALLLSIPVVRREPVRLNAGYFALMALEALLYSLLLDVAINIILEFVFSAIPSSMLGRSTLAAGLPLSPGATQGLALSLGAGLFEEFIFRVVLLGGLLLGARAFLPEHLAVVSSILLAALLFSAAHYIGPLADAFSFPGFMFRFIAGLLFTGLYFWRGFAITAYAHALYDIRVILL